MAVAARRAIQDHSRRREVISQEDLHRIKHNDQQKQKLQLLRQQQRWHGIGIGNDNNNRTCFLHHLSSELVAHCFSFLDPPTVYATLVEPMSKEWRQVFTLSKDVWRIICMMEPLNARYSSSIKSSSAYHHQDNNRGRSGENTRASYCSGSSSDESTFFSRSPTTIANRIAVSSSSASSSSLTVSRYRLLYTRFVRCMHYLNKIRDDAIHGRPPSMIDYGGTIIQRKRKRKQQQQQHRRRRSAVVIRREDSSATTHNNAERRRRKEKKKDSSTTSTSAIERGSPVGVADDNSSIGSSSCRSENDNNNGSIICFGNSNTTQRLLGPSMTGKKESADLPWSCAIYSIVNWMAAFSNVEGIQTMCLRALPAILEDENQRITAQRAGLTDVVLRGMVLFPHSQALNIEAFHTLVLLARPLGGKEGMLFHCSLVSSCGIFDQDAKQGTRNGIAVMLDSMKRFETNEVLQAMSCWSLVNIALAPSQKSSLVKLGGISVVANAMIQHPFSPEVQFRALFALINLVIPSIELTNEEQNKDREDNSESGSSEREILDEHVAQIANLVVVAMKNFCSSESILNRACLVLHNLSLTPEYHVTLLWTPNCYQMLEWCLVNHTGDQVLQQSAAGTLQRLQATLSKDADLRRRFQSLMQSHHQSSLEQAHREALQLLDQQERLATITPTVK